MNARIVFISTLLLAFGATATELNVAQHPLEIPQGAAPNIVVIMDDSGSMDWEIITAGYKNNGTFAHNNPFKVTGDKADEIRHKRHWTGGGVCTGSALGSSYGYLYGVEFGTNAHTDDANDCNTADEKAWRFRNSDYNKLYYDPTRTYRPWPGLSAYTSTQYPDGVPYEKLVEQFKTANSLGDDYLIGFDNPTNPQEWLDLTVNNTNYTANPPAGHTAESDVDGVSGADGFSYFLWEDTNDNGLFDGVYNDVTRVVGGGDTVTEVWVKDLTAVEQANFQNWFNFYRSREFSVKGALHYVLEDMITARIGYTQINSTANNFPVATMNPSAYATPSNKHTLLAKIDATQPNGGTPLRTALKGVGEYFSAASTGNRFGDGADPYLAADEGGTCQQNYALLFTDGYWNGTASPLVGNQDKRATGAGANPFDGGNFADTYSDTLADVAMKYYKTDLRPLIANEVVVTDSDVLLSNGYFSTGKETMHQHMKTFTVAFGLSLVGDFVKGTDKWPDPTASDDAKIVDLIHTAYNGRGNFYAANDYQSLASRLKDGFSKILADQSGAAGVSFNSQELKTGTFIFRAFYNPTTFDGDLVAVEFDENGVPQVDAPKWSASEQLKNLIVEGKERVIVSFDPDANAGISFAYDIDTDTGTGLNATQKAWFKGPLTDDTTDGDLRKGPAELPSPYGNGDADYADERVAFLHGDQDEEGTSFDKGELRQRSGLLGDFANSTPRYVGVPQGIKRDSEPYPTAAADRYSTFKDTYLDRAQLVYAGANDGMLHGFDATSGEEKFAYVPNLVMENLYKFTLPDYSHQMSVDGSPGINDIFIDDGRVLDQRWRTVLMGGLRAGGKGYYALDITDPSTFTKAGMPANVMWEFTSANDDRLGLSFSTPNMVMSNATMVVDCPEVIPAPTTTPTCTSPRWISLFGNGYNQTNAAGESALFALFMDRGGNTSWDRTNINGGANVATDDWIVMQTGEGSFTDDGTTNYTNGLGIPRAIDVDGNGTADYVYAGDLVGNLYRFDISSTDPADWAKTQILFKADYEVSTGVKSRQPITTQPIVTPNEGYGGYLVIMGTGSWMTEDDIASTGVQSLYGIWDRDPTVVDTTVKATEVVEQVYSNVLTPLLGYTYRTLTDNTVAYKVRNSSGNLGVYGWKIDFDMCAAGSSGSCAAEYPGERAIRNLLIKEGVLFGVTILPSSNKFCSDSPGGYLFSINVKTGGLVIERPAFDLNGDGRFDDSDLNNTGSATVTPDEVPAAIRIEDGLPSDIAVIDGGSSKGSKVCYQTSTGELVCTSANVDSKFAEGRLSWKELAD